MGTQREKRSAIKSSWKGPSEPSNNIFAMMTSIMMAKKDKTILAEKRMVVVMNTMMTTCLMTTKKKMRHYISAQLQIFLIIIVGEFQKLCR